MTMTPIKFGIIDNNGLAMFNLPKLKYTLEEVEHEIYVYEYVTATREEYYFRLVVRENSRTTFDYNPTISKEQARNIKKFFEMDKVASLALFKCFTTKQNL